MSEVGKEWASFIEKQLQAEEARRSSVVTRGGAAVASAAGLVTLLAVFAVFLGKDFEVSGLVGWALGVAVLALLVSAIYGVRIVMPAEYGYADVDILRQMTGPIESAPADDSGWKMDDDEARRSTASANIDIYENLRRGTDKQVCWLTTASIFQVIAVGALAAATVIVLVCPDSEVQRARNALNDQPGMSKFLDAVDAEGLLNSRDDVVKFASFYRLSCNAIEPSISQSPDSFRDHLKNDLDLTVSVDQVKALEPARIELCAAQ